MELQPLLETPDFAISHDAAHHWLYVAWRGEYNAVAAITGCLLILRHIEATRAQKILNDSSQMLDGWNEVTRWVGEEFFQQLASQGVAAVAWVKAHDWPAQAAIDKAMQYVTQPLVDTFDDTVTAYRWLDNIRV
ncbi:hypothetical protein MUN82_02410 [Hymenobacter aerilatus]|uniref:STAS/SEC14 domain-containing protein n=1 Tax=Hymenobacter aerilatus TaxID=2932251 RepID=A0A8T9SVR4_9BACT|nr:hypothetical protein [Hymenobacter aerilatus]UOR05965.1 hypothetical protein MUN82_02410 [Hymenobacter aerilatus]